MKNPVYLILLAAIVISGLIPAGMCAEPVGDAGSGFITVTNPPVAEFFTSTQFGTAPLLITFSDRSQGSPPLTYLWEFGDGSTSTDQNPTHAYTRDGRYAVSLSVTNRYGTDTKTIPDFISVGTMPAASFYAAPLQGTIPLTVNFTDTSGNGVTSWHWDFGDGTTSSAQNPTHIYTKTGTYTVSLSTVNRYGEGYRSMPGLINARLNSQHGIFC